MNGETIHHGLGRVDARKINKMQALDGGLNKWYLFISCRFNQVIIFNGVTIMASLPKGVYTTGGKGRKPCPHDGDHFLASRAIRCPLCKKDVPAKSTGKKVKAEGGLAIERAIPVIAELGGLKKVKAQIEAAEKAIAELERLGGLESARKTVALVEQLKSL